MPLGASTEAIETVTGLRPQALLREIPIPFCILGGEELRLVYANVAFERTFRGPVVAGLAVADVLSTPVVVALRDLVLRVRTQGYGEALEVWTPTGRFDFLATALAEPPGAVAVVAREAEAHAAAQERLSGELAAERAKVATSYAERALVEAAIEAVGALLCVVNADGRIVEANSAWRVHLGHKPSSLAGRRLLDVVVPQSQSAAQEIVDGALTGRSGRCAATFRHADQRAVAIALHAVADPRPGPPRALLVGQAIEAASLHAADPTS
ncbi:MAG TPA: PAS domain-containing protein [Candidatus Thermoplasmatota archaeon]|nr:PAS domain-containing protein [Candidatus Thermoplasmatota archaeon]